MIGFLYQSLVRWLFGEEETLPYWFIIIFARPGQGKSIEQARITDALLGEYRKTQKKYPSLPSRYVFTNQKLSHAIEERESDRNSLFYWETPESLKICPNKKCFKGVEPHGLHDCDLLIDEGATLFPAKKDDIPMWLRKLWAQHRHNGIRIIMLTQDFKGVNISIRRMCWKAYLMKKEMGSRDISATLPPLVPFSWKALFTFKPFVWGIYSKREIDPEIVENDVTAVKIQIKRLDDESEKADELRDLELIGRPEYRAITWEAINRYDTTQNVKEYDFKHELEHIVGICKFPNCGKTMETHKIA